MGLFSSRRQVADASCLRIYVLLSRKINILGSSRQQQHVVFTYGRGTDLHKKKCTWYDLSCAPATTLLQIQDNQPFPKCIRCPRESPNQILYACDHGVVSAGWLNPGIADESGLQDEDTNESIRSLSQPEVFAEGTDVIPTDRIDSFRGMATGGNTYVRAEFLTRRFSRFFQHREKTKKRQVEITKL